MFVEVSGGFIVVVCGAVPSGAFVVVGVFVVVVVGFVVVFVVVVAGFVVVVVVVVFLVVLVVVFSHSTRVGLQSLFVISFALGQMSS